MKSSTAESVRARLLNRTRERGDDFNLLLTRYALERWLYRLSVSDVQAQFVLKGALLFSLWFDVPHRPNRDAGLLAYGDADLDALQENVQMVCAIECDDGMRFDAESVQVTPIREDALYDGVRAGLVGWLGTARCKVQVDVGFGDAVTPAAKLRNLPTLLPDVPAPRLRVYPRETAAAEKIEAMITLGMRNSRMKDYYDLWVLLRRPGLNEELLSQAVCATCERRGTTLSSGWPDGLTEKFAADAAKQKQWQAFLSKNALEAPALGIVVTDIRMALAQPLAKARALASH